jgi:hypothetical protein
MRGIAPFMWAHLLTAAAKGEFQSLQQKPYSLSEEGLDLIAMEKRV